MKKIFSSPQFTLYGQMVFVFALFFYSFTQIDLSLTLSHASFLQEIQKSFQYVGYFTRPISAELYFFIVLGLFFFYIRTLDGIRKKILTQKQIMILTIVSAIVLMATYNAFSYDLFNYIFDAKIITFYHENPYLKKALDFPGDPMLSFMRWTHRTYPYGPGWLALSVPLSYAGLQIFTITFALFKILMATSYVGSCWFLSKILKKVSPTHALFGTAFFALNPLILIESLVSGHNDIVMMFLAIVAVYFLISRRIILACLFLALSISIKFVTVFLLPVFLYVLYSYWKKREPKWESVFAWMFTLMIVGVIGATYRTTFQPWYLLYLLPFAALLSYRKYFFSPLILLSTAALFNYIPYLFSGNWDPPIPSILTNLNVTAVIVAGMIFLLTLKQERKKV